MVIQLKEKRVELGPRVSHFLEYRRRFYQRLEEVRVQTDEVLNDIVAGESSINALARLEGLQMERRRVLDDFVQAEERFMEELLALSGRLSPEQEQQKPPE